MAKPWSNQRHYDRSIHGKQDFYRMIARPLALEPIDFESMHDQVYNQIRSVLMRGGFEPGQKLSGRKVAKALGTSEMPARAALGRLLAERALVKNSNGTFAVPVVTRRRFLEVMELRALVESHAAQQACEHITSGGLAELYAFSDGLRTAEKERDLERYLDFNQRLKFGIYKFCTSATLLSHIELLWLQCGPFLRHLSVDPDKAMAPSFCEDAINALARRDKLAAGDAISKDIMSGLSFLLSYGCFDPEVD